MRAKLEDNTQEALQFLLLGGAIVLGIRLLIAGADHLIGTGGDVALQEAIAGHRNGFLLDAQSWTIGAVAIEGRLAMALLLSIGAGILFSLIGAAFAAIVERSIIAMAVIFARWGLVIFLFTGIYCALLLPAESIRISDQGLHHTERAEFFGGTGIPFTGKESLIHWNGLDTVLSRSESTAAGGCGTIENVVLRTTEKELVIASTIPVGSDCALAIAAAHERNERLAAMLNQRIAGR